MEDGRLPWHPDDVPAPVRNAFVDYRKIANRALEREADDVAGALGLAHRANIEPHQAAALGLELPGEIDLLVADPRRGRLWVCEVKDVLWVPKIPSTAGELQFWLGVGSRQPAR